MLLAFSKPCKSLRLPPHRQLPRARSLDEAVNRLTIEAECRNKQCDQNIRMVKDLFQRTQRMTAHLDADGSELAHAGCVFLDTDLNAGMTLARIAAEAAPKTDRRIRNRQVAQRILKKVEHFASTWRLTEAERQELGNKITHLKEKLDALSEPV